MRHVCVIPAAVLLGSTFAANSAAQTPSDSTTLPPIVFGVGAVGVSLLNNTGIAGFGLDAELAVPLRDGGVGYRLHGFGTYLVNFGHTCSNCVAEGGSISGASLGLMYLADLQDRVAHTRISVGPALIADGENAENQVFYHLGADVGISRLVSVGQSSAYALSVEPVITKIDGSLVYFVMAGVGAEFW